MILIIMILTAVVSVHAMMSAGTLARLPTNTGSVVVHQVSNPSILNSIIPSSVNMHSVVPGTINIASIVLNTQKIPSASCTVEQQKISKLPTNEPIKVTTNEPIKVTTNEPVKVTTNEPVKPIRKEISPEALRALNERRQATLDKEMKSRMLQPKPSHSINPNHDDNHWSMAK